MTDLLMTSRKHGKGIWIMIEAWLKGIAIGLLSLLISSSAMAQKLVAKEPCEWETFRNRTLGHALTVLLRELARSKIPYENDFKHASIRSLGFVDDARFGGRVYFEEISFQDMNGQRYALHNVEAKTGVAQIDQAPFKVAFMKPLLEHWGVNGREIEIQCTVGFAQGNGMTSSAVQIFNLNRNNTLVWDLSATAIEETIPKIYTLATNRKY